MSHLLYVKIVSVLQIRNKCKNRETILNNNNTKYGNKVMIK